MLAESRRFSYLDSLTCADVDLQHLRQERMRTTSFGDCVEKDMCRKIGRGEVGDKVESGHA